jgi:hypothetical protein
MPLATAGDDWNKPPIGSLVQSGAHDPPPLTEPDAAAGRGITQTRCAGSHVASWVG